MISCQTSTNKYFRVSPSIIINLLSDYPLCLYTQIWVYGDSFKSMLVAVIVPNPETVNRWAKDLGFTKPFEELCSLPELKEHIISELKSTAEKNKV